MLTDSAALIRLLCFASPAFPTGGFAYSHGLEQVFEAGGVRDTASLTAWLDDVLRHGAGRSDLILLRHAHRAHRDPEALAMIGTCAAASCGGRERQEESLAQGAAFAASASPWCEVGAFAYPVVFGIVTAGQGIDEESACIGFLTAWTGNLISAAIRVGAMGQAGGLRVLASLEPTMFSVVSATRHSPLDDVGGCCFLADVASMQHETQYSRLFRS